MKRFLICIVLASVLIISCKEILFTGEESSREISLDDFHAVKFLGIYNIVLIQDSTNRLVIKGNNNINSIDALVNEDTLVINDHKKRSFNPNKNSLYLHFSNLQHIACYDPVNLSNTDTIKADQLTLYALGEIAEVRLVFRCNYFIAVNDANTLGYLHFIGKTQRCWIWDRYGSTMFADSLLCREAVVYNESVGDVRINASDNIDAFIRGPGNIYYHGNPIIKIGEKRGTGRIIRLD